MRAALLLLPAIILIAAPMSAGAATDPTWLAVTGEGCHAGASETNAAPFLVRIPAGPLVACGVPLAAPEALAGHRIKLGASYRTKPGSTANVALMLTQFRQGGIAWHQFVTAAVSPEGVASLVLRSTVLRDTDSAVVTVQTQNADAVVEVSDLVLVDASGPDDAPATSDDARRYLDDALRVIVDHAIALPSGRGRSLLRESRDVAGGAQRPDETYDAIRYALGQLDDRHSLFMDPATARQWAAAKPQPPYGIETALLDRDTAYLRISGFNALEQDERMAYVRFLEFMFRSALAAPSVKGLVIDLRSNDGGSLDPMLDGICPLFGPGAAPVMRFVDRRGVREGHRCRASGGAPARTRALARARRMPVAVLVGPTTASAGEMVAIALKGRHRTITIGSATQGLTTGNRLFPLRDGALLRLATSVATDRAGERYPHGVVPEIVVPPRTTASHDRADPAIVRARDWIAASIRAGDALDIAPHR